MPLWSCERQVNVVQGLRADALSSAPAIAECQWPLTSPNAFTQDWTPKAPTDRGARRMFMSARRRSSRCRRVAIAVLVGCPLGQPKRAQARGFSTSACCAGVSAESTFPFVLNCFSARRRLAALDRAGQKLSDLLSTGGRSHRTAPASRNIVGAVSSSALGREPT